MIRQWLFSSLSLSTNYLDFYRAIDFVLLLLFYLIVHYSTIFVLIRFVTLVLYRSYLFIFYVSFLLFLIYFLSWFMDCNFLYIFILFCQAFGLGYSSIYFPY